MLPRLFRSTGPTDGRDCCADEMGGDVGSAPLRVEALNFYKKALIAVRAGRAMVRFFSPPQLLEHVERLSIFSKGPSRILRLKKPAAQIVGIGLFNRKRGS